MENQQIGMFLFKCRKCGEIHGSLETAWENIFIILIQTVVSGQSDSKWGIPLRMLEIHSCDNGDYGISDLIGAVKK